MDNLQSNTSPSDTVAGGVAELPPPDKLSSDHRIAIINKFRAQTAAGNPLTQEESAYAIALLRQERALAAAKPARSGKAAKAAVPAVSLEDF